MSTAPETPLPVNEHDTTRQRVGAVAAWLVDGKLRPDCVVAAMEQWQVNRRMAQVYVARAAARIVKATTFEDPLFALKLSQVQRDKLHLELQELLRGNGLIEHKNWQLRLKTIQADLKLLDSRDRTAAKLLQLAPMNPATSKTRPDRTNTPARKENELPEKTLRPDPPAPQPPPRPQPPVENAKPQTQPHGGGITRRFMAHVQAGLREAVAQPSAAISIVSGDPKQKPDKKMRRRLESEPAAALDCISCALETNQVGNAEQPGIVRVAPAGGAASQIAT